MGQDIIDKLFMWGCDTDTALERVLGDEKIYLKFLRDYCKDDDLYKLRDFILADNSEEGFPLAHTLKGVYGNLGLTPLYDNMCEIAELLRNGKKPGVEEKMEKLLEIKKEYNEIVGI